MVVATWLAPTTASPNTSTLVEMFKDEGLELQKVMQESIASELLVIDEWIVGMLNAIVKG